MIQKSDHLETFPLLQSMFEFDDEDLKANRYGQVTMTQQKRLRKHIKSELFTLGAVFAWVITSIYGSLTGNWTTRSSEILHYIVVIVSIPVAILALKRIWETLQRYRCVSARNIDVVEVESTIFLRKGETTGSYVLSIEDFEFSIDEKQYDVLLTGETYRIYCVPVEKYILSIEPIYEDEVNILPIKSTTQLNYPPQFEKTKNINQQ